MKGGDTSKLATSHKAISRDICAISSPISIRALRNAYAATGPRTPRRSYLTEFLGKFGGIPPSFRNTFDLRPFVEGY